MPSKPMSDLDDAEYQSVLVYNKDTLRVDNRNIEKAIDQGLFRHNAKSIIENRKKQED